MSTAVAREERQAERRPTAVRWVAAGALVLAVAVLLWLLLRDDPYVVKARFSNASLVAGGNVVKLGGRRVGMVSDVHLTETGEAEIEMELDSDIAPLREGTEAHLRLAGLASSAGRYVDLRIPPAGGREIPDGGSIPTEDTQPIVDVDRIFSIFDEDTRRGLRRVVRGSGTQFRDAGELVDAGWRYLNPAFVASTRLFDELNRDSRALREFLDGSARLVSNLAARRDDLEAVVDRLATATGAIARREQELSSAIAQAPPFMRRANTTFVNVRRALDDLDPLVAASLPVAPRLEALLRQLQPFANEAIAPVGDLATAVRTPGADNDLVDLSRATPALRDIAVRSGRRNGETRRGSLPEATDALTRLTPIWAFWRPYGPDITGFLKAFGNPGIYDAAGVGTRSATIPSAFALQPDGTTRIVPPELRQELWDRLTVTQRNRCPGSVERPASDGSNPWRPTPAFNCDPSQIPPGR